MPFIRYTRDKRGCETTFVMHTYRPATGPARTRVLYMFRSPANLQVGRTALEPEVMEALEHTHPDLSFDWSVLQREAVTARAEPPERAGRPQAARGTPRQAPPRGAPPPAIDDQSVLGQALGAAEAGRLRGRYRDLVQRISRRARTPEDRDRLLERARRLNPDDWSDDAAVRAGLGTLEADWDAIAAELPSRRRGRRGGRRRGAPSDGPGAETAAAGAEAIRDEEGASGIMETGEDANAEVEDGDVGGPDLAARDPGDDRGLWAADDPAEHSDPGLPDDD